MLSACSHPKAKDIDGDEIQADVAAPQEAARFYATDTFALPVSVTQNGQPVHHADVRVTVNRPDGRGPFKRQAVTDINGQVFFSFYVADYFSNGTYVADIEVRYQEKVIGRGSSVFEVTR